MNCFTDPVLREFIKNAEAIDNCSFCGSENIHCIAPNELQEIFEPLIRLYSPIENFMPMEELKEREGDFLWEKLQDDWELFTEEVSEKKEDLLTSISKPSDPKDESKRQYISSFVEMPSKYWGIHDNFSETMVQYWDKFCHELIFNNRYFPQIDFELELISDLISFMTRKIKKGNILYRARISSENIKIDPVNMGKPPSHRSQSGRANPKGIPYLYLGSNRKTVIAEARPLILDCITIGKFKVIESLDIIDLINPSIESPFRLKNDLEYLLMYLEFLRKLGEELSKTINPQVADLQYVPLQYLCEFIKNKGYDGVAYKSSLTKGYNLAIYSDQKVKCISTERHKVHNIKYTSKNINADS